MENAQYVCARFPKFLGQPSQTPQFAVEINGADLCAELESLGCPRAQCKWDVICNLVSVARGERDGNIPSERLECVPLFLHWRNGSGTGRDLGIGRFGGGGRQPYRWRRREEDGLNA